MVMNHGGMHHSMTTMNMTHNSTMDHSGMDHSGMDHSGMDHSGMDHSGMDHDMGGMQMHMMQMYFNTDWQGSQVLFKEIVLNEPWHLAVACILLAVCAALYEGLKVLREHLLFMYGQAASGSESGSFNSKNNISITQGNPGSVRNRMCTWMHFLQTFLHLIQVTVSYLLMLVVMTYNVWLCISIVIGAGLGYFLFGWKRAVIIDANEHCH